MLFQKKKKKNQFKIAPSKCISKLLSQKPTSKLLPQKLISKLLPQKVHFKIFISEIHFKIAPSKNAFQNCCFSSIVIEGFKTLVFFTKRSKKKKNTNSTFRETKIFSMTLLECYNHYGTILVIKPLKTNYHYNELFIGVWKFFLCLINCSVNYWSLTPWKGF